MPKTEASGSQPTLEVLIEVARGSFLKRGSMGTVDFVSPLPCPFNYGSIPQYIGLEGDLLDAVVLGPRLARGARAGPPAPVRVGGRPHAPPGPGAPGPGRAARRHKGRRGWGGGQGPRKTRPGPRGTAPTATQPPRGPPRRLTATQTPPGPVSALGGFPVPDTRQRAGRPSRPRSAVRRNGTRWRRARRPRPPARRAGSAPVRRPHRWQ